MTRIKIDQNLHKQILTNILIVLELKKYKNEIKND